MLFAVRETTRPESRLQTLPRLRISGLPEPDARELLATARTVAGRRGGGPAHGRRAGGNPLALVDVTRELTAAQLEGRTPLPEPLSARAAARNTFVRRLRELPADQRLLLLRRRPTRAGATGCGERPAPSASRIRPQCPRRQPGWWSCGRRSGSPTRWSGRRSTTPRPPVERRAAHRALAAASDPELDADARAWHLAAAAAGPDDDVAAEQRRPPRARPGRLRAGRSCANGPRCSARTGAAGANDASPPPRPTCAGALDRADILLTEAAPFLQDPRSAARATGLAGRIGWPAVRWPSPPSVLVGAARRLRPLDPPAARDALLSAVEATVFAGWAPSGSLLQDDRPDGSDLPTTDHSPPRPSTCCCRATPRG